MEHLITTTASLVSSYSWILICRQHNSQQQQNVAKTCSRLPHLLVVDMVHHVWPYLYYMSKRVTLFVLASLEYWHFTWSQAVCEIQHLEWATELLQLTTHWLRNVYYFQIHALTHIAQKNSFNIMWYVTGKSAIVKFAVSLPIQYCMWSYPKEVKL